MYIVKFRALDFQRTKADDPTVPVGDPVTVLKGERVPDWVQEFTISALTNAGMIVFAADTEPAVFVPEPPRVRLPEQPPVLPSDPNGVPPLLGDRPGETAPEEAGDELPPLPRDADTKDTWERYATHPLIGMDLAEAEAMNKKDLLTEVKRRHAIAAEPVAP